MSWLFFMDESGHDHKKLPFEVRGGVTISIGKLWSLLQEWHRLERDCFGQRLAVYGNEAKGSKLLDRDRIRWAGQAPRLTDDERRKHARQFLEKGISKRAPSRIEFTAYGQACVEMARGVFDLLLSHDARLFACLIPCGVKPPGGFEQDEYLRKDHVFLFERLYYFLEGQKSHSLIVMDQTEKSNDRKFVDQMEAYFSRTALGRNRSHWIVPAPLFVSSEMATAVQAADICLYCINWGFRLQFWGKDIAVRDEIAMEFGPKLKRLQWEGDAIKDGNVYRSFGIVHVPDPYTPRSQK
jgi:hypothetical protein